MQSSLFEIFAVLLINLLFTLSANGKKQHVTFLFTHNIYGHYTENQNDYGGVPRAVTVIKKAKKASEVVKYFDGGGMISGTTYFNVYGTNISAEMMKKLSPDVMTVGRSDFYYGIETLKEYLSSVSSPKVLTNMINKHAVGLEMLNSSVTIEVGDISIVVLAYIDEDIKKTFDIGDADIVDPVESLRKEIRNIKENSKSSQNTIFVALGHAPFSVALKIATEIEDISFIIAGNPRTSLWLDDTDNFPVHLGIISRRATVMVTYGYGKCIGQFDITFDESKRIDRYEIRSVVLDGSHSQDEETLQILEDCKPRLRDYMKTVIGKTKVFLNGLSCEINECTFGNLVADAMVYQRAIYLAGKSSSGQWTDASIAVLTSNAIRKSIDPSRTGSTIKKGNVIPAIAHNQLLFVVELTGSDLIKIFEIASRVLKGEAETEFLIVSGIRIGFDKQMNITYLHVKCADCKIPIYEPVERTKTYKVITIQYLVDGGRRSQMNDTKFDMDGDYDCIMENAISIQAMIGVDLATCVFDYMENNGWLLAELDERIYYDFNVSTIDPITSRGESHQNRLVAYLEIFVLFLIISYTQI